MRANAGSSIVVLGMLVFGAALSTRGQQGPAVPTDVRSAPAAASAVSGVRVAVFRPTIPRQEAALVLETPSRPAELGPVQVNADDVRDLNWIAAR
jgi:hypothetical protein